MTRSEEEVIPCCSSDTEDSKRDKGAVSNFGLSQSYGLKKGFIALDDYSLHRLTGPLYFDSTYLHSEKELGLKFGDRVTYYHQPVSGDAVNTGF